jgi:hypothetical protein
VRSVRPQVKDVMLSCKHTVLYIVEPMPDDVVYCRRCAGYRTVEVIVTDYNYRCETCKHVKRYGEQGIRQATIGARGHLARNPGHKVVIRQGDHVMSGVGEQTEPYLDQNGAWLADHPEHQGGLRNLLPNCDRQPVGSPVDSTSDTETSSREIP